MQNKYKEFGADFSLFLVAVVWGATFVIVQEAINTTPVYTFLFWRFSIATILMAIFSCKHLVLMSKETFIGGTILGIFLFFGYAFQTFALSFTYSSTVGFITGLNVVIVPFVVYILFKHKTSKYSIFGAVIAAFGLYFLVAKDGVSFGKGEIFTLVCSAMFAFQIVLTGFYARKYNVYSLVTIQLLAVSILSFLGILVLNNPIMPLEFDGLFIKSILITSILATVLAFFIQTSMQRFTSPVKVAIIFTFEPVVAGIFGYYFANESFGPIQIFGAVLILAGMLSAEIGTYFKNKRAKSSLS